MCDAPTSDDDRRQVLTLEVQERVNNCAVLLSDTNLQAKLHVRELVAGDAKYHPKCLVSLYNRAERIRSVSDNVTQQSQLVSKNVIDDLIKIIIDSNEKVFTLADLKRLYIAELNNKGIKFNENIKSTTLKNKIIEAANGALFAFKQDRDIFIVTAETIGKALQFMRNDNDTTEEQTSLAGSPTIFVTFIRKLELFVHRI
ncbi:hypothetical protein B566_EDAN015613 [Ephemera danica]|nr:hypothetical protein B566_EDAN015613 [Ephemera danica]